MSSIPAGRNRPVKTCTECKQVKLRCDSKAKFPAPCTRCQTRGLHCSVDSSFRRTPARKRVEEMARELEELKSHRFDAAPTKPNVSLSSDMTRASSEHFSAMPTTIPTINATPEDASIDVFQLEDERMAREMAIGIFKIYAAFFYAHLPILDSVISPSTIYQYSPFLFWTLVIIVLGRQSEATHRDVFLRLKEPYTRMLQTEIVRAPLSLRSIQALLHLIIWPLPAVRQVEDPSWLLCGIATNATMYAGLNHVGPTRSYRSIGVVAGTPETRAKAWQGCFFASTVVSLFNGVPPPISSQSDLESVIALCGSNPPPRDFLVPIMAQHILAKFTGTVLNHSGTVVTQSLVRVIDGELDSLARRYPGPWTPRIEFNVHLAKLHLYAMSIIRTQTDHVVRDIFAELGLNSALRIVYLIDTGALAHTSPDFPEVMPERTVPKLYFRAVILASIFLLRYFSLNVKASPETREIARNHINISYTYFKRTSLCPGDELERAAFMLERLSRQEPVDIDNCKLRINDRMGASLVFDAINTGVELRNESAEIVEAPQHTPAATAPVLVANASNERLGYSDAEMIPDESFPAIDISVPQDVWGDSLWGMFDFGMGAPLP